MAFYTLGDEGYGILEEKKGIEERRAAEAKEAGEVLGIASLEFLGYPDMGIPQDKAILQKTIALLRRSRPDVIFAHHLQDMHPDHRIVARLAQDAFIFAGLHVALKLGDPWTASALYLYEVLTPFSPTHIVDISEEFEKVQEAWKRYRSQELVTTHAFRHLEGLTRMRGAAIGAERGQGLLRTFPLPEKLA